MSREDLWVCDLGWMDDQDQEGTIGRITVRATDKKEAISKILDEGWDNRLDSASCVPTFKWVREPRFSPGEIHFKEALEISDMAGRLLAEHQRQTIGWRIDAECGANVFEIIESYHGEGSILLALRTVVGRWYRVSKNAGEYADALRGLIDNEKDDLGQMLSPIVDLLQSIASATESVE